MTTFTEEKTATPAQQDANARAYIKSLLDHKPIDMGDVGKWIQYCRILGSSYEGNPGRIELVLDDLFHISAELKQLMADDPPLQGDKGPVVPELPESARLPTGFLPVEHKDQDWYMTWDSSRLAGVSPWLATYLKYSGRKSPEGYVDFHVASAMWVLSTVAARRIYVQLADRMYTPLAIALVARTSLFAKTRTAQAGVKVLKQAGLGWLLGDDETTPQKLLADMSGKIPNNYDEMDERKKRAVERRIAMSGQLGWFYDEFNQLVDAMTRPGPMAEFTGLMRKLDDCQDEYKYSTRMHGQEVIPKPYLSFLANTTPANLRRHAAKHGQFWNDGFWARFVLVAPPLHAWKTKTMSMGEVTVFDYLSQSLSNWNTRLGEPHCEIIETVDMKGKRTNQYAEIQPLPQHEVTLDRDVYDAYVRYREALRSLIAGMSNHDLDGSYVRLSDITLRMAALFGSLENNNQITLEIWTVAQEIAEIFRRNLHELYSQVTDGQFEKDPYETILSDFLKLQKGRALTVREICQYAPLEIRKQKAKTIREMLQELERSGEVELIKSNKTERYKSIK